MAGRLLLVVLPVVTLVACGAPTAPSSARATPATSPAPSTSPASPSTPATITSSPAARPPFTSSVATVTAADLPSSYHPGCPTPPDQLRLLTLSYVDFTGEAQTGHLVVNARVVPQVVAIFADLYAHAFPIRQMVPVDAFGGSDDRSVAADNTAGFNCRAAVTTGPASWSMHAYGEAIDVDPVENPYVESNGVVDPPNGAAFVDRSDVRPGMAVPGGELVEAFARQGWRWGVTFGDYQHFSTNGK